MAAYISFQPSDFFSTLLYSYGAPPSSVTGVGFSSNMVVIKSINGTSGANNWYAGNTVMGNTISNNWNGTAIETSTDSITSYDADGYTMGADATNNINETGTNYVAYSWKAGTSSGLSGGTITPTAYSFSATAGVSIVQYDGNSTSGATVPHGLGVAPKMVMVKCLDTAENWCLGHTSFGFTKWIPLDTSGTPTTTSVTWNDTAPSSTVVTLGANSIVNTHTTLGYIMYAFANVKGFQHHGSYTGNGDVDGPMVYTGFRPAFVMVKRLDSSDNWVCFDNKRQGYNETNYISYPNLNLAEATSTPYFDIVANGFKVRWTDSKANTGGNTYLYSAWAEFPIVSSNSKAGVAR